jgi:hypothetical protein
MQAERLIYTGGLAYTSSGSIIDVGAANVVGYFTTRPPVPIGHVSVVADAALDRLYLLILGPSVGTGVFTVQVYQLSTWSLLDSGHFAFDFGNVATPMRRRFEQYGTNGLAVVTADGRLFLIDGTLVH